MPTRLLPSDSGCRWLLWTHAVAAVALLAVCLLLFSAADGCRLWVALTVAYAVPAAAVARWAGRRHCVRWVFLLAGVWLTALAVSSAYFSTVAVGATFEHPILSGDAKGYFSQALYFYDGSHEAVPMTFYGTSLLMAAIWHLLGVSLAWPLVLNVSCTLAAMAVYAWAAQALMRRAAPDADAATVVAVALLILTTWGYFCAVGASMLKEAQVFLPMSLVFAALTLFTGPSAHRHRWHTVALLAVGCTVLALVRAKFLYFVGLGVVMAAATAQGRRQWRTAAALFAVVFAAWLLGNVTAGHRYTVAVQMQTIAGHEMLRQSFGIKQVLIGIIGDYYSLGQVHRLLLTPFSMAVQYIIPFPWGASGVSLGEFVSRSPWGWYAAGGLALFYYGYASWRGQPLGLLAWWPVAVAAIIAHLTAGTVSRYMLVFRPMLLPAVASARPRVAPAPAPLGSLLHRPYHRHSACVPQHCPVAPHQRQRYLA